MATVRSSKIVRSVDDPQLRVVAEALVYDRIVSVIITLDDGGTLTLPVTLLPVIEHLILRLATGEDISINTLEEEYTLTEAVDFLGVTDSYLTGLIAAGELPVRGAGTEQRIPFPFLAAYRAKMLERMKEGVRRIQQLSEEEGAYDG